MRGFIKTVKINFCPSCGIELAERRFICPECNLNIEEFFEKGNSFSNNDEDNSVELFDGNEELIVVENEGDILNNDKINVNSGDEIVIVVPEGIDEDEIVIDLDELGIDVENLDGDVNIVIEVEGADFEDNEFIDDGDEIVEPNEWFFDDDPYDIVYYEFVNDEDEYE